ncbi:tyrosine-type recombinase/integrase [Aneurinibacillus migulanus]|uniref:site-specific integrase n=1 Tax=Aneurinibacillus migulanus TaxID=47500 RepID=UPI002E21AAEF|nr:tyrosine-type recombinase/integrase [Aneurinibacillus migulanus]MED4726829.1 tyrosine-type recombinase/integrase [Aneurinibacillus migulanus]
MKGHARKRGSKWSFVIDLGRDEVTGKRKQKWFSGYKTKKEAEKACAEMILQIENGQYVVESEQTYGDYLMQYLENIAQHSVRASTYQLHLFIATKHIIPKLGKKKLQSIKPMHLQEFYTQKIKEGLATSYIRNMHAIISKSLKKAAEWGLIKENIASLVTPPRIEKKQVKTWTLEEANQFLYKIKERKTGNKKLYIAYVLAIYCGMRKGEILGLCWKDCNFEKGYISIQQTLVKIKGSLSLQEPKTKGSIRTIKVPDFALQILKAHKIKQMEIKLRVGSAYKEHDLVVANWNGSMIDPADINADFKIACKFADVPQIRFHDLRHTHATLLLQLGENPKVVSERLGHADISITLNTYSHVLPNMQESLAQNFDLAMKKSEKKPG